MPRARIAGLAAAGLLASGSVAVASHAGTAVVWPAVTTARVVTTEQGFDAASAPPTSTIRAWSDSPYRAVNMYFSGSQRFDTTQSELSQLWVTTVLANGWDIIPTVVDLQAPCYSGQTQKARMSTNTATARQQGKDAANDAVDGTGHFGNSTTNFNALGVSKGAIAYIDIEPFTVPSGNTTCRPAVRAFLAGWTTQMRTRGYRAGVYSRPVDAIKLLVAKRSDSSYPQPDAIWFARWDGVANTKSSEIPSDYLRNHRIHQYLNTSDSYAGLSLPIDKDAIGGDVITASSVTLPSGPPYTYSASVPDGLVLHERTAPSTGSPFSTGKLTYGDGAAIQIMCQAAGVPGDPKGVVHGDYVWDRLADGSYVSDIYTSTTGGNGFSNAIPRCDTVDPTVSVTPLRKATLRSSATVSWSGSDIDSGISSYNVKWHRAAYNGGFGTWHTSQTTATSTTISLATGSTYCVKVQAVDRSGNASDYSTPTCTTRPLDDRSLNAATTGWIRKTGKDYYLGTYTATTSYHRALRRSGAQVRTVGVVATTCSTCGRIAVLLNGNRIGTLDLHASTTHRRHISLFTPLSALTSGTITIRTLSSGKSVQIDGVVLSRVALNA